MIVPSSWTVCAIPFDGADRLFASRQIMLSEQGVSRPPPTQPRKAPMKAIASPAWRIKASRAVSISGAARRALATEHEPRSADGSMIGNFAASLSCRPFGPEKAKSTGRDVEADSVSSMSPKSLQIDCSTARRSSVRLNWPLTLKFLRNLGRGTGPEAGVTLEEAIKSGRSGSASPAATRPEAADAAGSIRASGLHLELWDGLRRAHHRVSPLSCGRKRVGDRSG